MSIRIIIVLVMYALLVIKNLFLAFDEEDYPDFLNCFNSAFLFYPALVLYAFAKPIFLCGLLYLIFC